MRVSAREELASPHEGTGGAGPVLSRRYWPSRPCDIGGGRGEV